MPKKKEGQAIIKCIECNIPKLENSLITKVYFLFGIGKLCQHEYTALQDYPFILIQSHAQLVHRGFIKERNTMSQKDISQAWKKILSTLQELNANCSTTMSQK